MTSSHRNPLRADLCNVTLERKYPDAVGQVFYIMQAYAVPTLERVIAEIGTELMDALGLSLVCLEGSVGKIDTSLFTSFPDKEIRASVAEHFLEQGKISGMELLAITSDRDFELWGADDKELYLQMHEVIRPLLEDGPSWTDRFELLRKELREAGAEWLSPGLRQFLKEYERAEAAEFVGQIRLLEEYAEHLEFDLERLPKTQRLLEVVEEEKTIDFPRADAEQNAAARLLEEMVNSPQTLLQRSLKMAGIDPERGEVGQLLRQFANLPPGQLRELDARLANTPMGRLIQYAQRTNREDPDTPALPDPIRLFSAGFAEVASETIRMAKGLEQGSVSHLQFLDFIIDLLVLFGEDDRKYANMIKFAHYKHRYESVTVQDLFREIMHLRTAIAGRLCRSERDKEYRALQRLLDLLGQLFAARITLSDFTELQASGRATRHTRLCDTLDRLMPQSPRVRDLRGAAEAYERMRRTATRFYTILQERSTRIARNTLTRMRDTGCDSATLVSGGAHRDPVLAVFEMHRVSHTVVAPRCRDLLLDDRQLYANVMLGRKMSSEETPDEREREKGSR